MPPVFRSRTPTTPFSLSQQFLNEFLQLEVQGQDDGVADHRAGSRKLICWIFSTLFLMTVWLPFVPFQERLVLFFDAAAADRVAEAVGAGRTRIQFRLADLGNVAQDMGGAFRPAG